MTIPGDILGFDARELGPRVQSLWDSDRQRLYSLRDNTRPLSVDTLVWPSVFVDSVFGNAGWVEHPDWIGANNLWDDLEKMGQCLSQAVRPVNAPPFWKIAVTWHRESEQDKPPDTRPPYLEPTRPSALPPSWSFLGYDIADPNISGLSNCGYSEGREALKQVWGPRLNEHHLLTQLDDAFEFRRLTNLRVREHAPFFVLGLWSIAEPPRAVGESGDDLDDA